MKRFRERTMSLDVGGTSGIGWVAMKRARRHDPLEWILDLLLAVILAAAVALFAFKYVVGL